MYLSPLNRPDEEHLKYSEITKSMETTPTPDWRDEFIKQFYVYDLIAGSPAGAEKKAVAFISRILEEQWQVAHEESVEAFIEGQKSGREQAVAYIRKWLDEEDVITGGEIGMSSLDYVLDYAARTNHIQTKS
jgi:hypothetical protein